MVHLQQGATSFSAAPLFGPVRAEQGGIQKQEGLMRYVTSSVGPWLRSPGARRSVRPTPLAPVMVAAAVLDITCRVIRVVTSMTCLARQPAPTRAHASPPRTHRPGVPARSGPLPAYCRRTCGT